MSELLKQAFEKAAAELPDYEQDEFARWLLNVIESDERRWDVAFAQSPEKLKKLGDEALEAFRAGRAELLDPAKL
jgi:hypothetical protein